MRLIHVHTFRLCEFLGHPSTFLNYAILSHTWEDDEVSFQDFQDLSLASRMKTYLSTWLLGVFGLAVIYCSRSDG